jgi:hypothetical protein
MIREARESDWVVRVLLPAGVELLELLACADSDPVSENLKRDALMWSA